MKPSLSRLLHDHAWSFLLLVAYLLLLVTLSIMLPDRLVINFFHDDSFFYVKTAQNIRNGIGSTFDGINATNGYHPLYMWLLILVSLVSPFHSFAGVRPLLVVHGLLLIGACLVMERVMSFLSVKKEWRFVTLVAIIGATGFVDLGIEAPVLLLTAWAFIYAVAVLLKFQSVLGAMSVALLSVGVCLARTDAILFIISEAMVVAFAAGYRSRSLWAAVRILMVMVVPAALAIGAVGLYNLANYGHFGSISSSLKIHWPGTFATHWFNGAIAGVKVRMAIPVLVAFLAIPWLLRKVLSAYNDRVFTRLDVQSVLIGANIYVIVHALVLLLFASGGVASWYFALTLTIALVTAGYGAQAMVASIKLGGAWDRVLSAASLAVLLLAITLYLSPRFVIAAGRLDQLAVAGWLQQHVTTSAAIFQVDATGVTGYFSERAVINGDGLINSWEYQDYLRGGHIREYLNNKQVAYVVSHVSPENGWIRVDIPTWDGSGVYLGSAPLSAALFTAGDYSIFRMDAFQVDGQPID